MIPFEKELSVAVEDIEFELRGFTAVAWSDFVLNPRRLRGSDFLMRWSQGVWSEDRIVQAVKATDEYFALPYGPSGTAPDDDVRAFELYFERLERAGLNDVKRPDLLIFDKRHSREIDQIVHRLGGISELPFTPEDHRDIQAILTRALIAVECENSLWKASLMPHYGAELRPQRRLGGKPGLPRNAVLPTIIIKEEDRRRLQDWQAQQGIKIHIWHVFYDMAFGISLDEAERRIEEGYITPIAQTFQAPGGATSRKTIFKIYYHYGYPVGDSHRDPSLVAAHIVDKNGHILPYVRFEGGEMALRPEALEVLREASR